jgi:hypothetical protein
MRFLLPAALAVAMAAECRAAAFDRGELLGSGFSPRVPVSALARPAAWFDPSRLQVSTSVSVGSGFGGGTNALQITSFSYRFGTPLYMNVNVGNAWGPGSARGRSFFLQGLDVGYRPWPGLMFQVHYRDVRSPLQVPAGYGYGYGYADPGFFDFRDDSRGRLP